MHALSYLDSFRKRMEAEGGSVAKSYENSTAKAIESTFKDSPFYKKVTVNGVEYDARLMKTSRQLRGKEAEYKNLTFLPYTVLDRGSIVEFDSQKWIILDYNSNGVYPRAYIEHCNQTVKWADSLGVVKEHPCAITNISPIALNLQDDRQMTLQTGQFRVFVQLNADTKEIKLIQRFVFGSNVYEVTGIDDFSGVLNGVGLLDIAITATTKKAEDDIANHLADNSALYRGGTGTGGVIGW